MRWATSGDAIALRVTIHEFHLKLHAVAQEHEEISDTEVRAILGWAIHHFFNWDNGIDRLPQCYGMFEREAKAEGLTTEKQRVHVLEEERFTHAGGRTTTTSFWDPAKARSSTTAPPRTLPAALPFRITPRLTTNRGGGVYRRRSLPRALRFSLRAA